VAVEDVCNAIELSLEQGVDGIYNIGSDNPPCLNDLFRRTLTDLGVRKMVFKIPMRIAVLIFDFLDRLGISPLTPEQYKIAGLNYILDTDKIKSTLGWRPVKNDETMLRESLVDLLSSK
jgi:nucleoside-diphosphate-sugar epimerase